jgi:phage gp36-like protein
MSEVPPPLPLPRPPDSAYGVTVDDLVARLTSRTLAAVTDDATGRNIDAALVGGKILDAETVFHSYAGVYYVTPISGDSPDFTLARKIVIDLAAWELLSRRPHAISGDTGEIERTRYESTLAWLKGLASRARTVQLTSSLERADGVPRGGGATVIAEEAAFTREALGAF